MLNPSGLFPGDNWNFSSECDIPGVAYSQAAVRTGPWSLAFNSRNFGGVTTCGDATGTVRHLVPGKTYKVLGWRTTQGPSVGRNLTVSVDGGVGVIGTISGVTVDASTWKGFAFAFVARQATHVVTLSQPPGSSSTLFTRYVDDVAVAEVVQGVSATLRSLSPGASGESLAPSATPASDAPIGPPGYGG